MKTRNDPDSVGHHHRAAVDRNQLRGVGRRQCHDPLRLLHPVSQAQRAKIDQGRYQRRRQRAPISIGSMACKLSTIRRRHLGRTPQGLIRPVPWLSTGNGFAAQGGSGGGGSVVRDAAAGDWLQREISTATAAGSDRLPSPAIMSASRRRSCADRSLPVERRRGADDRMKGRGSGLCRRFRRRGEGRHGLARIRSPWRRSSPRRWSSSNPTARPLT